MSPASPAPDAEPEPMTPVPDTESEPEQLEKEGEIPQSAFIPPVPLPLDDEPVQPILFHISEGDDGRSVLIDPGCFG